MSKLLELPKTQIEGGGTDATRKPPVDTHYFSRKVASEKGIKEALLLGFLAYKTKTSKNRRNEKAWYYDSLDAIQKRFPYMKRSAIGDALKVLATEEGTLQVGKFNRMKADRTQWFHVPKETRAMVEKDLIALDVEIATRLGMAEGILIEHIRYRSKKEPEVLLQPAVLHQKLPFLSKSTIKRAIKQLIDAGCVEKVESTSKGTKVKLKQNLEKQPESSTGSNADEGGPIVDKGGSNTDEGGSNADTNTHYNAFGNSFGNTIQCSPAAEHGLVVGKELEKEDEADPAIKRFLCDEGFAHLREESAALIKGAIEQWEDVKVQLMIRAFGVYAYNFIIKCDIADLAINADSARYQDIIVQFFPKYFEFFKKQITDRPEQEKFFPIAGELFVSLIADCYDKRLDKPLHPLLVKTFGEFRNPVAMRVTHFLNQVWVYEQDEFYSKAASPDEDNPHLAPQEKVQVVENALRVFNEAGFVYKHPDGRQQLVHRCDALLFQPHSLVALRKFFDANPDLWPGIIIGLMKRCAEKNAVLEYDENCEEECFYAKKAVNLSFLLKYMEKVLDDLEIDYGAMGIKFLTNEQLFGKRKDDEGE